MSTATRMLMAAAGIKAGTAPPPPPPPSRGNTYGTRAGFAPGGALGSTGGSLSGDMSKMAATGARYVRLYVDWSSIQPTSATAFSWTYLDSVVSAAAAAGLTMIGILTYSPAWANGGFANNNVPPVNTSDYATFCSAAVNRYKGQGLHIWEVWNEPNNGTLWQPVNVAGANAAAYTALLKAAAPAIRGADPTAFIISGGLAPETDTAPNISPRTFLQGIYTAGGASSFDAVGIHPYCWPFGPAAH